MPNENNKPKRKYRSDPEICRLRHAYLEQVNAYKMRRNSSLLLKTIIQKRLPKMVTADREALLDELMKTTTRSLFKDPVQACDKGM